MYELEGKKRERKNELHTLLYMVGLGEGALICEGTRLVQTGVLPLVDFLPVSPQGSSALVCSVAL